jgi:GTP cyclohydrolase IA
MTQQYTAFDHFIGLGGFSQSFDKETERRVSDFYRELEQNRMYDRFTTFESKTDEMIVGNHLRLFSICQHHLLPYFGEVTIGYIPQGKIFGLSKFQRAIDKYASMPTIQEELTRSILRFFEDQLNPRGVGVVIKAIHTCVMARGTKSADAEFTTTMLTGRFKENADTRAEFLKYVTDSRLRL